MEESAKAQPFGKRVAAICIYATIYYAVLALVIGFGSEVFARAVCALWVLAVVGPGLTLSRLFTERRERPRTFSAGMDSAGSEAALQSPYPYLLMA